MGLLDNQVWLMADISRQSDLELESQQIGQHRLYLSNMVSGYFNLHARLEPGSRAARTLDAKIKQLQQADKLLEMHLNRINTQVEAIKKRRESTKKMISENIQNTFGLLGK